MNPLSTLLVPISQDALRLLSAEAKANGLTVEEQYRRTLEKGYPVSAEHVIERVLADARLAAADAAAFAEAQRERAA